MTTPRPPNPPAPCAASTPSDPAPIAGFDHVRHWVFDLDNTLYPPKARLFDQIERRMTAYVMRSLGLARDQADSMRRQYWGLYGTTLAGLMAEHDIDPLPYLQDVHDIDLSHLTPDPGLAAAIAALPGRRIVYTNGSAPYAERVLAARGLSGLFDAVYGVEDADFRPKPERAAFETIFRRDGVIAAQGAMFEDDLRNLLVPHALGMRTVHVAPRPEAAGAPHAPAESAPPESAPYDSRAWPPAHVDHHTDDLGAFLRRLTR